MAASGNRWLAWPRMSDGTFDIRRLGWDDAWREAADACAVSGRVGRVSRVDRGLLTALTVNGPVRATFGADVLDAMAGNPLCAPVTGDWCVLRPWSDGPFTVEGLLPRRTTVVRAEASGSSRGQALAANADVVAIVVALHPEPNLGRVERLLTLAWGSGARPMVVLSKADLVGDAELVATDVRAVAPDVDVVCTSTVDDSGIQQVRSRAGRNATLALVGLSGHGKSSLANALVGAEVLAAKRIRADGKGRHTTVRRELVPLPGGGAVIDTPGLRGVGVPGGTLGLSVTFAEVDRLAAGCRFLDCSHQTEPGCAVLAAVAAGLLPVRRLESWRSLHAEQAWMAARARRRLRQAGR